MICDYEGCKREVVSGGNIIVDVQGDVAHVDLCAFHLKKLWKQACVKEEKDWGKKMTEFRFDVTPFKKIKEVHLIIKDKFGGKERISFEDIQDGVKEIILEIKEDSD